MVSEHTEQHPEPLRFVLWHEIAHLARRDDVLRRLTAALVFGLLIAALASIDPGAMAIAFVGVLLVAVTGHWWSETACDRLAARHAGVGALHAWAAGRRAIVVILRRNKALSRRARAKGLLTHPPLALRTAFHPHVSQESPTTDRETSR